MLRNRRIKKQEADLDITSFMNLMVVLVPVLLMMMVFSHITVLELKLPGLSELIEQPEKLDENSELEVIVRQQGIMVYYPAGKLINKIENIEKGYDFDTLVKTLKTVKSLLHEHDINKSNITLLLEPEIDYQTIITLMDKARSYKAVVVASVVDAELFPEISLGDAPILSTIDNTAVNAGENQ